MIVVLVLCMALLLGLGIAEKRRCLGSRQAVPLRVNVNGIRGKSTVTRLVTGVLAEAGHNVMGKTTGTAPRILRPNAEEEEIARRPEGANIKEQVGILNLAAAEGRDALVCECMAVRPEYQAVFQHDMLGANLYVIVNVLEDHLDVMGPRLDQIAEAFAEAIPYDGKLVLMDGPYRPYFEQVAAARGTRVYVGDTARVSQEYLDGFEYVVFPENAALALAVAQALGIPEETAFRGMRRAAPDPGALRIQPVEKYHTTLVHAFAANDVESSLSVWQCVGRYVVPDAPPVILFNGREDRVDRTKQFIKGFFGEFPGATLVGVGDGLGVLQRAWARGELAGLEGYVHLEGKGPEEALQALLPLAQNRIILGVGNIHGEVLQPLLALLLEEAPGAAKGTLRVKQGA